MPMVWKRRVSRVVNWCWLLRPMLAILAGKRASARFALLRLRDQDGVKQALQALLA